jgi:dTDP-4-amino-4,6-dideoxygalactose transaminase
LNSCANIPFLDLVSQHIELEPELLEVFRSALRKAAFVGGAMVEEFEKSFSEFCSVEHCVGVANGTDALRFALIASGIKPGDVVITVPNTFIATAEAISQAGALPEFVDVDELTYNMDPTALRRYLVEQCEFVEGRLMSRRSHRPVTAVVPVHLYGQMADMDPILELADEFNLIVVEDACQAHGAKYFSRKREQWQTAGSLGRAAAFSFYPGKNLGACGEGGAVTTRDPEVAKIIRMLRDHGQAKKYYHDLEGYNGRLDALQAGFLSVKLKRLPAWNAQRQEIAREYRRLFAASEADAVLPFEPDWSRAVYHLYVVRVQNRETLQQDLAQAGIGTAIHYPVPLHQQKAYSHLKYQSGDFTVAERVAPQIVSLPMFPQMTSEQVQQVVTAVAHSTALKLAAAAAH